VHRAFLLLVWLLNGYLFYLCMRRVGQALRLSATGLFLASAFILQAYALHTEIFILTAFLVGTLAVVRRSVAAALVVGLMASVALFIKPLGPVAFIPCWCYLLANRTSRVRQIVLTFAGGLLPILLVTWYLLEHDTIVEAWRQIVLDNVHIGFALSADWFGYTVLAVVPLLVPLFVGLVLVDKRPDEVEWWLTAIVFSGLLAIEVLRGARHYGLLNLCLLAWMAVRAQDKLQIRARVESIGLGLLVGLAAVFQVATVSEILARGLITDELSASAFDRALMPGSLQVFSNNPPRVYMLLNDLEPAYPYLFVYDTNRELVIWDSYINMIQASPPDYIAVEDTFNAVEYGSLRSSALTNADAVNTWIEREGNYRRLDVGRSLGLTLYRRALSGQGGTQS
jgi:hypothetical protein